LGRGSPFNVSYQNCWKKNIYVNDSQNLAFPTSHFVYCVMLSDMVTYCAMLSDMVAYCVKLSDMAPCCEGQIEGVAQIN
jgi:hypothetical protein